MTILGSTEVTCAICAESSEHTTIVSTNAFGSADLDLRPPEMKRSTMTYWLQECPSCGYSASSIDEAHRDARTGMESAAFQALQSGPLNQTLTGRLLKASLLSEKCGDTQSAADFALWAAWAADDANDDNGARNYRGKAADLFIEALRVRPESLCSDQTS
jgi:hypothetical protein